MTCPKCGSYLSDHTRFCSRCGADMKNVAEVDPRRYIARRGKGQTAKQESVQITGPSPPPAPRPAPPSVSEQHAQNLTSQMTAAGGYGAWKQRQSKNSQSATVAGIIAVVVAFIVLISVMTGAFDETVYMSGDSVYSDDVVNIDFSFVGNNGGEWEQVGFVGNDNSYPQYSKDNISFTVIASGEVDDSVLDAVSGMTDGESVQSAFDSYLRGTYSQIVTDAISDNILPLSEVPDAEVYWASFPPSTVSYAAYASGKLLGEEMNADQGRFVVVLSPSLRSYVCIMMERYDWHDAEYGENGNSEYGEDGAEYLLSSLLENSIYFHDSPDYEDMENWNDWSDAVGYWGNSADEDDDWVDEDDY